MRTTKKKTVMRKTAKVSTKSKQAAVRAETAENGQPLITPNERVLNLARKQKGKLTYDDLNDLLPEDATSEQIDDVMVALGEVIIEIVDEFRVNAETQRKRKAEENKARKAEIRRDSAQ